MQSAEAIKQRIAQHGPSALKFIKDRPGLGWRLRSADPADIPAAIAKHLGAVDQTGYTADYLSKNVGTVIALQMSGDGPDFYIVGKPVYDSKYEQVALPEVAAKNPKLMERLNAVPELAALLKKAGDNIVGILKTVPVEMIRMSDVNYPVSEKVTIQSPWGEQTKPAGKEGYLVFDASNGQHYLVNQGPDGNPLSYVPAR